MFCCDANRALMILTFLLICVWPCDRVLHGCIYGVWVSLSLPTQCLGFVAVLECQWLSIFSRNVQFWLGSTFNFGFNAPKVNYCSTENETEQREQKSRTKLQHWQSNAFVVRRCPSFVSVTFERFENALTHAVLRQFSHEPLCCMARVLQNQCSNISVQLYVYVVGVAPGMHILS